MKSGEFIPLATILAFTDVYAKNDLQMNTGCLRVDMNMYLILLRQLKIF